MRHIYTVEYYITTHNTMNQSFVEQKQQIRRIILYNFLDRKFRSRQNYTMIEQEQKEKKGQS